MIRPGTGPGAAWLLALVFLAALHLAARWLGGPVAPVAAPDSARVDAARLARASAAPVIFLGTSLTACALPFEDEWPDPHPANAPPVFRLTRGDGEQEDFLPLLDAVARSKARIILIEAEMLLRKRPPAPPSPLHDAASWYRKPIRDVVGSWLAGTSPAHAAGRAATDRAASHDCPNVDLARPALYKMIISENRPLRSEPWRPEWLRFIARAPDRGQKVILVSLGRSATVQRNLDPDFVAAYERNLQAAVSANRLQLWVFDATQMPDANFRDGAHMNARGRKIFTRWLTARLASESAQR